MTYGYDFINLYNSSYSPSTLHTKNNGLYNFFRKYLMQKVMSVFEFELPESWASNYFMYTLFMRGFIAVVNTDRFGVICQESGLQGYNVFYNPTHAVITNPLLTGILTPQIGIQCELIKLQPDYSGVSDIVGYYADNMAMAAEACEMNVANSKLSYLFSANGKSQAESLKKILDAVQRGELGVFYDEKLRTRNGTMNDKPWETFATNLKQNFIAPDLQDTMRRWEELFCNEVGIPNVRSDKKERLITAEAESNNIECSSKSALWLETMKADIEKVNKMFGLDISVKMRYGGENDVSYDRLEGTDVMGQQVTE